MKKALSLLLALAVWMPVLGSCGPAEPADADVQQVETVLPKEPESTDEANNPPEQIEETEPSYSRENYSVYPTSFPSHHSIAIFLYAASRQSYQSWTRPRSTTASLNLRNAPFPRMA